MTWADFYLVCFVVGFFLSLLMFLAGGLHLHIPHFHLHAPARQKPAFVRHEVHLFASAASHARNAAHTNTSAQMKNAK